ncbi:MULTISPECIES: methyl-accepting chemotaxis protein [Thalassospira]|uniref:Chemotaxis protein n=2 Tax=Thalassospira TaxID=168934 RepID=A0A367WES0_9PROT|nr:MULTISPECIES: methyl-accepting chemotaxis protein [Thalassospira]MDG4717528.1 methyl-accepting chemotaxis protein [Thalassospira sp. FZY0004]RCK39002.1 chemotaxis protein [Thalassospira profundimaris]
MNHTSAMPENTIYARISETKDLFAQHADRIAESLIAELLGTGQSSADKSAPQTLVPDLAKQFRALAAATSADVFNHCFANHALAKAASDLTPDAIVLAYYKAAANCAALASSTKGIRPTPALLDAARCVLMADMGNLMGNLQRQASQQRASSEIQSMSEIIERETDNIISEVGFQAGRTNDVAQTMEKDAGELSQLVERITSTTEIASGNVATVASATEELQASSHEIAERIHKTNDIAGQAVIRAQETSHTMNSLSETASEIGKVVDIVKRISDQTKMLALNATIEAARAGDAGKGFAVVANEVKNLATQTEKAILDINSQITAIQGATSEAVTAIEGIGGAIDEVSQLSADISASVEQQTAAIGEISTSAQEVSTHMRGISSDIELASQKSQNASETAENLRILASNIRNDINEMESRFRTVLRSTESANRRHEDRVPIAVDIKVDFGSGDIRNGVTADMSMAGLLARIDAAEKDRNKPITITMVDGTVLHGVIKAVSALGTHVQFTEVDEKATQVIMGHLKKTHDHDNKIAELGKQLSLDLAKVLESGLRNNEIKREDLFNPRYEPVSGSDPKQFITPYIPFTDRHFTPLQEAILEKDKHIVFAAGVDFNGYLPTHNKIYSHPQRPGEAAWNMGNCRNRRIFDDRAGLMAARNTKPHLLQTYFRDMGNSVVFMKECDVPIIVNGEQWGNLRIGYRA